MIVSSEKILKRIDELLLLNEQVLKNDGAWSLANMEKSILGTLTIIKMTYGEGSNQETFLTTLRDEYFNLSQDTENVSKIVIHITATLETLKSDIEFDFIESIEKKAIGEVYGDLRWPNFHGQKNLLNLEINYGSEKAKREPTQV
jgi:hypothetical protein